MCIISFMNKLALYLQATGATQEEFAARVSVDQSTISRLVRGGRPGWGLAARIAHVTGGEVGIADWVPEGSMQPARKHRVKNGGAGLLDRRASA